MTTKIVEDCQSPFSILWWGNNTNNRLTLIFLHVNCEQENFQFHPLSLSHIVFNREHLLPNVNNRND